MTLSKYGKMKKQDECKNNESHTFTIKTVYAINSSTVVYGGDILSFHMNTKCNFEA